MAPFLGKVIIKTIIKKYIIINKCFSNLNKNLIPSLRSILNTSISEKSKESKGQSSFDDEILSEDSSNYYKNFVLSD